jgi:Na+/H+ antiporter NhaD/arsenite permease-like protein
VTAALGGAVVMLLIGATDAEHAFFSADAGIDWNVIFLLLGMMLIVAVVKQTGAFEYLAIWAIKRARGRPFRVMVVLVLVTAFISAGLDNVTTVLLVAPVTFLVCERLAVPVAPFLIAEALASNIGGTATLVGDPPNIIIASRGGLSYNDFLVHLAPFVVAAMVVFVGLCRVLFRSAFRYDPQRAAQIAGLREGDSIRDRRLLVVSLAVLALVTVAFVLHTVLHLEPAVVAIVGGLLLLVLSRLDADEVVKDVEWPTLAFFAGLFVMVGALVNTGVIEELSRAAVEANPGAGGDAGCAAPC